MGAEVNEDMVVLQNGRRGCVTVLAIDLARIVAAKNLLVVKQATRLTIEANSAQRPALRFGRGEPDLIVL